jgi:hypothetical protein
LAGLLVLFTGAAWAQNRHQNRVADEKLVAQIDFSSWLPETFRVSPDNKRIAYITFHYFARKGSCVVLVEETVE